MLSWAVPQSLPTTTRQRRLAVRTEDHPLAYSWFEGVIPAGYGAGSVIVADRGRWTVEPADDAVTLDPRTRTEIVDRMLDEGHLRFALHGRTMSGRFSMIHTDDERWLLVRRGEPAEVPSSTHARSVLSGRTLAEIADLTPPHWSPASPDELAALAELPAAGRWEIDGRSLDLTNLDKVLISGTPQRPPVTKRELVAYYASAAPALAPYLAGRPVNLRRFPDGDERPGFWQRNVPAGAPDWLTTWDDPVERRGRRHVHVVVDGVATLAWIAGQAGIEIHPWTSTAADPDRPTWLYFDIDPGPTTSWDDVTTLVELHRVALDHLGLTGCPKVTGGRGIHVWVPTPIGTTFDQTKRLAADISRVIAGRVPDRVSAQWRVADRDGRARLDHTQNGIGRTLVAPFSARAAPGAPVSVPVSWDELTDGEIASDAWSIREVADRIASAGDPMAALTAGRHLLDPLPVM